MPMPYAECLVSNGSVRVVSLAGIEGDLSVSDAFDYCEDMLGEKVISIKNLSDIVTVEE